MRARNQKAFVDGKRLPSGIRSWAKTVVTPVLGIVPLVLATLLATPAIASEPTAATALERSIEYHDPAGRWFASTAALSIRQERPDRATRRVELEFPPSSDRFAMTMEEAAARIEGRLEGDECTVSPTEATADLRERFGNLDCKALRWWRGYYGYLLSAPMNLRDPGAKLAPDVDRVEWEGRDALRLTVSYEPGKPIWNYYLDPASYRLLGCSFSSDGSEKDGELIVFEGEVEASGVRLPESRTWYHADGHKYAGRDVVESFRFEP